MLAAQHGQRIELWSRRKIRTEIGIDRLCREIRPGLMARIIPSNMFAACSAQR